jgi:hypothetical protein
MRYVLHFNPAGTTLLGTDKNAIEFSKLPKALKNGAVTKVRLSDTGTHKFTPRDEYGTRYGAAVSESVARDAGLRGRKRYTLEQAGKSEWFNLVPHSSIGAKSKRIDGAGVSVSIIERK